MPRAPLAGKLGLAAASILCCLGLAEVGLRLAHYRFAPIVFLPPDSPADHRAYHLSALDPRVSLTEPLTVFDPELLWRLNPKATPRINAQGYRGDLLSKPKLPSDFVIVAVGDSNTLGPLETADEWPGYLRDLIALNPQRWNMRVTNAGVYGYSSLQGLRRFREVLPYQPDLVYFSFGANDAHRVHVSDADYARKAAWLRGWTWLRLAPPLANLAWTAFGGSRPAGAPTNRVPPAEYRRNLQEFVRLARGRGSAPVLLTRPYRGVSSDPEYWMSYAPQYNAITRAVAEETGVACLDAYEVFREKPDLFVDESHFNRHGHQEMARLLLHHLKSLGLVPSEHVYAREVAFGEVEDTRPELDFGWWAAEKWSGGASGRWTAGAAALRLERRREEGALALDLSLQRPEGRTSGWIAVNGISVERFDKPNGRYHWVTSVRDVPGAILEVRFVVEHPFVTGRSSAHPDSRALGVFVHSAGLIRSRFAREVQLGSLDDGRPELGPGFWRPEAWDGAPGRWTRKEAVLTLGRAEDEDGLELEVSFQSPFGTTSGRIFANGEPVGRFEDENGRRRLLLDIGRVKGNDVVIQMALDKAFQPRLSVAGSDDARILGIFVHSARLIRLPPR